MLAELAKGMERRRADVAKHFRVCPRTVKRDLRDLEGRRLIKYRREPRPGHYAI